MPLLVQDDFSYIFYMWIPGWFKREQDLLQMDAV